MTKIRHHIPSEFLAAYAAGSLSHPFAVVVATHVSMCAECRAELEAHHAVGGAVLESLPAETIHADSKAAVLAALDDVAPAAPSPKRAGIYPGPLAEAIGGDTPRWKHVGLGTKQAVLYRGRAGSVRLLHIPPGQAVPDHSHRGIEMTLVLQGSFFDEDAEFGVGDVELADDSVEHTPVAGAGQPCICLAATEAPLRFSGMLPRILQPVLGI